MQSFAAVQSRAVDFDHIALTIQTACRSKINRHVLGRQVVFGHWIAVGADLPCAVRSEWAYRGYLQIPGWLQLRRFLRSPLLDL